MVPMDSRALVGLTFIVLMTIILAGSYSALMPTQLEIKVHNRDATSHQVEINLTRGGETVQTWKLTVESGKTRSVQYPVDIGSFRIAASLQGKSNVTSDFEIPFKFLDKTHTETFTVISSGLFKGNIY